MNISLLLAANSIAFGGLLFLLSAGFALIFGLTLCSAPISVCR